MHSLFGDASAPTAVRGRFVALSSQSDSVLACTNRSAKDLAIADAGGLSLLSHGATKLGLSGNVPTDRIGRTFFIQLGVTS